MCFLKTKAIGLWGRKVNSGTTREKILGAYETLAERYNERIDHKPHNAYYDRPNTLKLLGEVAGKHILDAACGPGKYAEILLGKGAEVVGFDLSPKMIEMARKRNGKDTLFFVHDLTQPLNRFEDENFDAVLCALALHYIEDWQPVIQEFSRVLRKGGSVVVSIEHPFFEYNYFKSKDYFKVEEVSATWRGFGGRVVVPSYRRPLMACLQPFTENGFYIDALVEPLPVREFEKYNPRHYKELMKFPAFMCFKAVKK
ncbi:MAG: class I SAM-dependent methyltransferase [Bacteroidota bacterium]